MRQKSDKKCDKKNFITKEINKKRELWETPYRKKHRGIK
jgi:hypothetical protein